MYGKDDMLMRVAIYIRVSTEEQRINGLSIDTQKAALTEYATQHNMEIMNYYIDAGLSARKRLSNRKELLRLLSDVENGLIDLIIFTKLDRWFRNIADYYKVQELLDKYKVNWKTIYENYDTSTANGRLYINIMLSIAQDEADRTSERIKVVFENKRSKGETPANRAPLGYKIVNSKLLIDENTKELAIAIFNYYDIHHSVTGCVRMCREKYLRNIYEYTIRRMFENAIYIGEFRGHKEFCEPLIDRDLFFRVQNYREVREYKNQLKAGRVYLFSTLVFCKECKHNMSSCFTTQRQKHGQKEFHYYRCKEAVHHKCCHRKRINEEYLEDYLINNLVAALEGKLLVIRQSLRAGNSNKVEAAKARKRIEKLKELYLEDLIDKENYKLEYASLMSTLNNAIDFSSAAAEKSNFSLVTDWKAIYDQMTLQERKAFWLGMIDTIVVDAENNIDFYLRI